MRFTSVAETAFLDRRSAPEGEHVCSRYTSFGVIIILKFMSETPVKQTLTCFVWPKDAMRLSRGSILRNRWFGRFGYELPHEALRLKAYQGCSKFLERGNVLIPKALRPH